MIRKIIIGILLSLSFSNAIAKSEDAFKSFYKYYKVGEYQLAIDELQKSDDGKNEAERSYLLGLALKNLQKNADAVVYFKRALVLGFTSADILYEYAQSLFAINELDRAKKAFELSFKSGFKPDVSLYYLAYIGELLEDPQSTKVNYVKILKDPRSSGEMKQLAYFKLGELIYEKIKNKFYVEEYIEKYVAPLMKKGIAVDDESPLADEIRTKYDEILIRHNMHPLLLVNGRMLSRKSTTFTFSQEFAQDTNVSLASDSPSFASVNSDAGSSVLVSDLFYSVRFLSVLRRFVFTPELNINYTDYLNDTNPDVYKNDSYYIAPALRGAYEFSWNKKTASLLYEYEYNYTARDSQEVGERSFYGRSGTYNLGLRYPFTERTETTFKLRYKDLSSFADYITGTTSTIYFDHLWVRKNGHVLIFMAYMDQYRAAEDYYSTNSYYARVDYLIPHLISEIDFNLGIGMNMLDTMAQSDERGTEKTYDLSLKMFYRFHKSWRLGTNTSWTKNTSLNTEDYAYSKYYYSVELGYSY